jgi:flagellar biosynthetic protein FlhB
MDEFAQKIKEVARENGVYLYENVQLARKLYADVEVNEIIPRELYSFVIYAYKLALENKNRREAEVL